MNSWKQFCHDGPVHFQVTGLLCPTLKFCKLLTPPCNNHVCQKRRTLAPPPLGRICESTYLNPCLYLHGCRPPCCRGAPHVPLSPVANLCRKPLLQGFLVGRLSEEHCTLQTRLSRRGLNPLALLHSLSQQGCPDLLQTRCSRAAAI